MDGPDAGLEPSDSRRPLLVNDQRRDKPSTLLTVCPYILGNEFCERLAYYGLATNLVVYFERFAGANASAAAANVGLWGGSCYLTPLLGAWIADSYLGRYHTILGFTLIYLVDDDTVLTDTAEAPGNDGIITQGMMALTLHPLLLAPEAGETPSMQANALLYGALYMVALGTGGIKPNVSAFGAEQFDDKHPNDVREKQSFFNWFYFAINVGSLLASLVVVYIQENVSWVLGFGIPTVALFLAVVSFWGGRHRYHKTKPKESPIARALSVIWSALTTPAAAHERAYVKDWLDRAVLRGRFSLVQVHEVRLVLRVLPVFATSVVYWTIYQQMSSVFVQQGLQMNRETPWLTIPSASLSTFDTVSVVVLVPFFEVVVFPALAAFGCRPTLLQKMGWGLLVAAGSMAVAAVVEHYRLHAALNGHVVPNSSPPVADMSVFWQVPQYVLIGVSEVLASIAQLEFFYDQAPRPMRSCAMALQLLSSALGMYLSSAILFTVEKFTQPTPWITDNLNEGRLDLYFLLLAGLTLANLFAHVLVSLQYEYRAPALPPRPTLPTSAYQPPAPIYTLSGDQRAHTAAMPIAGGGAHEGDVARSVTSMAQTPLLPANFR